MCSSASWGSEPPFSCRRPCGCMCLRKSLFKCPCVFECPSLGATCLRVTPSFVSVYSSDSEVRGVCHRARWCLMWFLCHRATVMCHCTTHYIFWVSDHQRRGYIHVLCHVHRPVHVDLRWHMCRSICVSTGTAPMVLCILGLSP